MADRKPLKVLPDGGGDSTGLGEFVAADTVGIVDGGTGLATVGSNQLLTGNGTSALTSESNLTFDGSSNTLTVTGDQHIANGGALVVGNTAQVATNTITAETQIQGTANADATMSVSRYSADTTPPRIHLAKSRNATIGNVTGAVASGDSLGQLVFCGSDGTDFNNMGAYIECPVTGSVSGDTMPAALTFHTNAGGSIAERIRILSSGGITFNGDTAAANALDDYEEGTFTPVVKYGSGGSYTAYTMYSGTYGTYVKVGQIVHFNIQAQIDNPSASNDSNIIVVFTGLPYTSHAGNSGANQYEYNTPTMRIGHWSEGNAYPTPYINPNDTMVVGFKSYDNGTGWTNIRTDEIYRSSGSNYFILSGSYRAA